jgi:hypothetical protein
MIENTLAHCVALPKQLALFMNHYLQHQHQHQTTTTTTTHMGDLPSKISMVCASVNQQALATCINTKHLLLYSPLAVGCCNAAICR